MPHVNHQILIWARQTAGLGPEAAVEKLDIKDARGVSALDRLAALESGEEEPSRSMLVRMAKHYRRPLLTFYMSAPPRKGDRGQDFRTLPQGHPGAADALLDVLIRDIRARQGLVRAVLEDDEETRPLSCVGSATMENGVAAVLTSIRATLGIDLAEYRAQPTADDAFELLRNRAEAVGLFVLLIGNLGSHHTAIDLETFRGFAIADPIAPFVVINDQDAKAAWSFTLLHELAHIWLGATGVSGASADLAIERFCNEVASEFLLSGSELPALQVQDGTELHVAIERINQFANERNLSRSMIAYRLYQAGIIQERKWRELSTAFRDEWLRDRAIRRERESEGGPSYYVVRRHRLGSALLEFARRTLSEGVLTPTKAGKILGVKPRNVEPLLSRVTPVNSNRIA